MWIIQAIISLMCTQLYRETWKKNMVNIHPDLCFYHAWLLLYDFSKLIKTAVNLLVPNGWMLPPVKHVIKCQSM